MTAGCSERAEEACEKNGFEFEKREDGAKDQMTKWMGRLVSG